MKYSSRKNFIGVGKKMQRSSKLLFATAAGSIGMLGMSNIAPSGYSECVAINQSGECIDALRAQPAVKGPDNGVILQEYDVPLDGAIRDAVDRIVGQEAAGQRYIAQQPEPQWIPAQQQQQVDINDALIAAIRQDVIRELKAATQLAPGVQLVHQPARVRPQDDLVALINAIVEKRLNGARIVLSNDHRLHPAVVAPARPVQVIIEPQPQQPQYVQLVQAAPQQAIQVRVPMEMAYQLPVQPQCQLVQYQPPGNMMQQLFMPQQQQQAPPPWMIHKMRDGDAFYVEGNGRPPQIGQYANGRFCMLPPPGPAQVPQRQRGIPVRPAYANNVYAGLGRRPRRRGRRSGSSYYSTTATRGSRSNGSSSYYESSSGSTMSSSSLFSTPSYS